MAEIQRLALARATSLLAAVALGGCSSSLIQRVQKFQAQRATGNRDAALAYLADDARIWFESRDGPGRPWQLDGPWSRWDEFFHASRTDQDWEAGDSQVSATAIEVNDFYRLIEREPWPTRLTWYFDDTGKINGFFVRPLRSGTPRSRIEEFKQWAQVHLPEELGYLMPDGQISPEGDRPERWKTALEEWRRAAGLAPLE